MSTKEYLRKWRARNIDRCREYARRYYQKNKEEIKARTTAYRDANKEQFNAIQRRRARVLREGTRWYKVVKGCSDCGEHDPTILEFDHVRGKKEINLGGTTLLGRPHVWKEMQKCDVVCANCHSRRTHARK